MRILLTQDDHLLGVDLNRNNPPYWATNPKRSSNVPKASFTTALRPFRT